MDPIQAHALDKFTCRSTFSFLQGTFQHIEKSLTLCCNVRDANCLTRFHPNCRIHLLNAATLSLMITESPGRIGAAQRWSSISSGTERFHHGQTVRSSLTGPFLIYFSPQRFTGLIITIGVFKVKRKISRRTLSFFSCYFSHLQGLMS